MSEENRIDIYTIPPNFAEEGTLLSGRVKTRNALETAFILAGLVPLILSLHVPGKTKIYIGMVVLVPVVILAVMGVQGESLFAFIASFIRYVKRRRILSVPDERYRLEQSRRKERAEKGGKRSREKGKKRKRPEKNLEKGAYEDQEGVQAGTEKTGAKAGKRKRQKRADKGKTGSR